MSSFYVNVSSQVSDNHPDNNTVDFTSDLVREIPINSDYDVQCWSNY